MDVPGEGPRLTAMVTQSCRWAETGTKASRYRTVRSRLTNEPWEGFRQVNVLPAGERMSQPIGMDE